MIVNLTPHDIIVFLDKEENVIEEVEKAMKSDDHEREERLKALALEGKIEFFPSEGAARVETRTEKVGELNGIPLYSQVFGEIYDLPEPQEGVYYLCSLPVRQKAKLIGRTDVIGPDTSPAGVIRDKKGGILGTKWFVV